MHVIVNCPICGKKGRINISEKTLKNVSRGLLAVNVSNGIVCDHSFIAYIDKNMAVRDYFMPDFELELPTVEIIKEDSQKKTPCKEDLDIELLKLNIIPSLLVYLIRMIIAKKNPIIILKEPSLERHIQALFEFITEGSFDFNFTFMNEKEYKERKKEFRERVVFKGKKVINDSGKLMDLKKLKVEQRLIERFYSETDVNTSLIILKNELLKIYKLAKKIDNYVVQTKELNGLTFSDIIDYLC